MNPSATSRTSSGWYSTMDRPFPLRTICNAGFVTPSFDRHARRVRKNSHIHEWCEYLPPPYPSIPKRKFVPQNNPPESPVVERVKRQRQFQPFDCCFLTDSETSTSDSSSDWSGSTAFSQGYRFNEPPMSWFHGAGFLGNRPTPPTDLFSREDRTFHAAAAAHFAGLDVEGLIASPGHELVCHDHLSRGASVIYHDLAPHPPRWHCTCRGCQSHGVYLPTHDPSYRCFCIACMTFVAKQKQKLEATLAVRRYEALQAENAEIFEDARRVQAYRQMLQPENEEEEEEDDVMDELEWEEFLHECEQDEAEAARELFELQMGRIRSLGKN